MGCPRVKMMKKLNKTLREYLKELDLDSVFNYLLNNKKETVSNLDGYKYFIELMLSYPENINSRKLYIQKLIGVKDVEFIDVTTLNDEYEVEPDISLKPWGGNRHLKDDCPEGHYNCNYNGYQKSFGILGDFHLYSDSEIYIDDNIHDMCKSENEIISEILYELTFYGFTDEEVKKFESELNLDDEGIEDGRKELSNEK
jgi:hypothetical protein